MTKDEYIMQTSDTITKDDLKKLIETLTENQIEYAYYLLKGLFCECSD